MSRSERVILILTIAIFAVGCLPTALGDLVNLTVFNVAFNKIQGQLSTRSEAPTFPTHLALLNEIRAMAGAPRAVGPFSAKSSS